MRVIVSDELTQYYEKYKVVRTCKELLALNDIECVIIHKTEEKMLDIGITLAELHKQGVRKFLYVSEDVSSLTSSCIESLGGIVEDCDFYFSDEKDLDDLVDSLGVDDISLPATSKPILVISDFIQGFLTNDPRVNTPMYLDSVKRSIAELQETCHSQSLTIKDMSSSAITVFEEASSAIRMMEEQKSKLEESLRGIYARTSGKQETMISTASAGRDRDVIFYPPFNYQRNTPLLQITELTPCRYLTSFVFAYKNYLEENLCMHVKLVFVVQKGHGELSRIPDATSITLESKNVPSVYDADVVVTNIPSNPVMKKLTSGGDDLVIVVDRLGTGKPFVQGGGTKTLKAVSGVSAIKKYKARAKECICSVTEFQNSFLYIPVFKKYPTDAESRIGVYVNHFDDDFKRLNNLLGIGV